MEEGGGVKGVSFVLEETTDLTTWESMALPDPDETPRYAGNGWWLVPQPGGNLLKVRLPWMPPGGFKCSS